MEGGSCLESQLLNIQNSAIEFVTVLSFTYRNKSRRVFVMRRKKKLVLVSSFICVICRMEKSARGVDYWPFIRVQVYAVSIESLTLKESRIHP